MAKQKVTLQFSGAAHADRAGLMNWMRQLRVAPKNIFITHGEPQAADALRIVIQENLGWADMAPVINRSLKFRY
jgi:metallo-beta-lactamase family protein